MNRSRRSFRHLLRNTSLKPTLSLNSQKTGCNSKPSTPSTTQTTKNALHHRPFPQNCASYNSLCPLPKSQKRRKPSNAPPNAQRGQQRACRPRNQPCCKLPPILDPESFPRTCSKTQNCRLYTDLKKPSTSSETHNFSQPLQF